MQFEFIHSRDGSELFQVLEFVRDGTQRGVQLHLAVELLFPFEPGIQLLPFPLLRLNRLEAGDVLRETLACARGQWDVAANDLFVEAGKIERDGKRWTLGIQQLRL